MPLDFVVRGEVFDAATLIKTAPKAPKKPPSERDQHWHGGWVVEGHPPGAIEAAQAAAERATSHWIGLGADGQKAARERGEREPKAWDAERWKLTAAKKRVRKPFEIHDSAKQCVGLAQKAGWLCVVVRELKKD